MDQINSYRLGTKIFSAMAMATVLCDVGMLLFLNFTGESVKWNIVLLVVLLLALYSAIYSAVWKEGYRERNRVQCGYSQEDLLKGLKGGALAVVPQYLLIALMLALRAFNVDISGVYRLINFFAITLINAFMTPGAEICDVAAWKILASSCFVAVVPLVSWGAYVLGYYRFSFTDILVYRKKATPLTREEASKIKRRR
jgi:hypothetical protein